MEILATHTQAGHAEPRKPQPYPSFSEAGRLAMVVLEHIAEVGDMELRAIKKGVDMVAGREVSLSQHTRDTKDSRPDLYPQKELHKPQDLFAAEADSPLTQVFS